MGPDEVRGLRKRRGWTQQELATAVGVALSSVARWESAGGRPPKGASLRALRQLAREPEAGGAAVPVARGDRGTDIGDTGKEDLAATVDSLMGEIKCPKGFICARSGFENLCRAREIGLSSHLQCLEPDPSSCAFSVSYEQDCLCECPLRGYLFRKLGR